MANRTELTLIDGSTTYDFPIAASNGAKLFKRQTRGWEPHDPVLPWRIPLHPWDAGLQQDKLHNKRGYTKANADASYRGLLLPPPLLNSITIPTTDVPQKASFRAVATASATATSLTVDKPTGTVDNDLMLAFITHRTVETITAPGGWTLVRTVDSSLARTAVYRKIAASEGANYQWTATTSEVWTGSITTIKDVDTTTPINAENGQQGSGTITSVPTPSITPTSVGTLLVCLFFYDSAVGTWTPPTYMTERADFGLTNTTQEVATGQINTTSSISKSATHSSGTSGANFTSYILAINPTTATPSVSANFTKAVEFDSKVWFASGRYLVSVNSSYTAVIERDLGSGFVISDLEVFNNELVIALGSSTAIWTVDASGTFTESVDATYAIALGKVDNKLWRAETGALVSNCLTSPLTLASWTPAAGSQYEVGDSTREITDIIDYGGVPWVIKPDGVYAPDTKSEFHNQAPQLAQWPDADNGKGSFVAEGSLFVPSLPGLLRLSFGESKIVGPELSNRPGFRFHTHGGVEWGETLFVVCHDHAAVDNTFVCKIQRNQGELPYIYHEWCRLGATTTSEVIALSALPTNPTLFVGLGAALKYIKLGRGGGRDVDDANYGYGLSYELETGVLAPVDLGLTSVLVGVKVVADMASDESLSISYKTNYAAAYTDLLTTAEGGGTAAITNTSGYAAVTRYAAANITGQLLEFKFTGTISGSVAGVDRPEIREAYAFGYSRPDTIHLFQVGILADARARVHGLGQGRSAGEVVRIFSEWQDDQTILTAELPDYEESRTTRVRVVNVEETMEEIIELGSKPEKVSVCMVTLERIDFAGVISDA